MRRSAFMNVPSFSNDEQAGRNTVRELPRRLGEEQILHDEQLERARAPWRVSSARGLVRKMS